MNLGALALRWSALAVAVALGACRGRTQPAVDWKPGPGVSTEAAALLLLDQDGTTQLACLPGRTRARRLFPGVALRRILDTGWKGGPLLAGLAAASDQGDAPDDLVLLMPNQAPRRLAKSVRSARFSPDGAALAYEVTHSPASDPGLAPATSFVLDLATSKVTEVGALADPLWEADGRHLRGTRLRAAGEDGGAWAAHWASLRARWDRDSGATAVDGPGSAQVPAPVGSAVAWTENQRGPDAPSPCAVFLSRRGGVMHSTVGRFCKGIADDRSARWSPDGRLLAFPHPGRLPGQRKTRGFLVDVVTIEGGRDPALTALHERVRPEQLAIAPAPGSVWFDWSPSGRFLAMHDGASELRVYDFEAHGIALLGKGQRPMWSKGGAYLLVLAAGQAATDADGASLEASVLSAPTARIDLGPVLDARWLPADACEKQPTVVGGDPVR
jgi:hypothetical protein